MARERCHCASELFPCRIQTATRTASPYQCHCYARKNSINQLMSVGSGQKTSIKPGELAPSNTLFAHHINDFMEKKSASLFLTITSVETR